MNDIQGLGMTRESSSLKVFLDVFILLTMPDQCRRNEVVYLNIDVFSHLKKNQSVALSFQRNGGEFEVLKSAYDGWNDGKY
jgi:Alpha-2-macroglobulin family